MTVYNKAIRDKIPEIIKQSGGNCNIKILSNKEFLEELDKKLGEELQEYQEDKSIEELADIMEIIEKIIKLRGITLNDLEKIKVGKLEKHGGFEKNLFLIESNEN